MSFASLEAHADAVLALLYAETRLTVFPAAEPGPRVAPNKVAPPYVTVHFASIRPKSGRLTMRSTAMRMRIYAHCSGATDASARVTADLVAGVLLDAIPTLPGRVVYPIAHETSQQDNRPPREDESTSRLVSTLTEVYLLRTEAGR